MVFAGPSNQSSEADLLDELQWPAEQLWDIFDLVSGAVERAVDLSQQPHQLELAPFGARALLMRPAHEVRPLFSSEPLQRSGVLLSLSSLPSYWGIGDFGEAAFAFIDLLTATGQTVWQLLPLNPLGKGNSPYQSEAALALDPLFINPERLWDFLEEGVGVSAVDLLRSEAYKQRGEDLQESATASGQINYPSVTAIKERLLRAAYACWAEQGKSLTSTPDFLEFCQNNAAWLEDYALFKALQGEGGGLPWTEWPRELRTRDELALQTARERLRAEVDYQVFVQYVAERQLRELRSYANNRSRLLMGDIPIFVAANSVDCWTHQKLFWLDEDGAPTVVSGVPPDYFSEEGQLWENPLYRWERMESDDYAWWRVRLERALQHFDLLRLDHFRGFEAYWQINANEPTAVNGLWMKGPGRRLFESLTRTLGPLPIIAEDLGFITPEVELLKEWFGYPGMKVLPFDYPDLSGDASTVYYSGTHDNDTLLGWLDQWDTEPPPAPDQWDVVSPPAAPTPRLLCEELFASGAVLVLLPVQDILGLGSEARMNHPGTQEGNWQWCMDEIEAMDQESWEWLQGITKATGRFF